ncbi:hypothetical protein DSM03_11027 [Leeuwenhoekiella aestuarii]|uniref:Curli production assembly/transport component CsgE n=1 Tax=Leeuwenhoekiella aestuarii TaxID=2249426 RepID=A0A4Q0NWX2_9FLAO|nr:CsgE family curli-type amyloid fiber assembly protein [Leeuwenhoekiella aestuarii]RXG12440.1 hypothetical protein DSM03_11027 [Leeuwenhoekiella aestuarii]RXG16454.1 hypothetical protein DSM04_10227 [Leeuwenhoekiella aestuarii]
MFVLNPKHTTLFFLLFINLATAQFMNKDIRATILLERNSEFLKFIPTAENRTNVDYNLRFDFMVFETKPDGKIEKGNKEDRIFLKAREKLILPYVTIDYNATNKIIIVLIIYDLENRPIGQDRIVLDKGGQTDLSTFENVIDGQNLSPDQARPQDGFVLNGFVIENTITKAGKDFYRFYYNEYFNKQIKTPHNILIEEVPGRGRFTRVSVKVADQLVWQFFAQPRKEILKKNASIALSRSIAYLQQLEQRKDEFIHY